MNKYTLKVSVILKNINENTCYALDCEEDDEYFYKFEDAAKFFIESLYEADTDGLSSNELITMAMNNFPSAKEEDLKKDIEDFFQSIKSLTVN